MLIVTIYIKTTWGLLNVLRWWNMLRLWLLHPYVFGLIMITIFFILLLFVHWIIALIIIALYLFWREKGN